MGKPAQASGNHGMTPQRSGMPGVKQGMPGPESKQVNYKTPASPIAPSKGQTARSHQGGATSPRTDGGGGMGNDSAALHRMICGK